jgi:exopolyphosphatase / guanosine-5'-triphosphate,3'-diphosphate pyrophosphatase
MAVKAALDIGSNSSKLLVLDLRSDGYSVLWDESRVTGMGKGVGASGELAAEALERTFNTVSEFVGRARNLGAESIRAAGTAALRNASNREVFTGRLQRELGVAVEVLTGEEEARLARAVALRELPPGAQAVAFFDTGGGSTEVTLCRGEEILGEVSLPLGARRCTEDAGLLQPVTPQARARLEAIIETKLLEAPHLPAGQRKPGAVQLAGLGGTATNVVWMLQGARGLGIGDPHLARVALGELNGLLELLSPMPLREVEARPNLDPARAEVIYAGIAIIKGLCAHYQADSFTLVDRGLRWGLLLG